MFFSVDETEVDLFTYCQHDPLTRIINFGVIILCPQFWNIRDFTTHSNCLTVNKYQQNFYQEGYGMMTAKIWLLLDELVEFYIPEYDLEKVVYEANDCLRLIGRDAVKNPANYVYYLASESILLSQN